MVHNVSETITVIIMEKEEIILEEHDLLTNHKIEVSPYYNSIASCYLLILYFIEKR